MSFPPFRLGECRVHPGLNLIEGPSECCHVQPRVMRVLVCLAESAGQTVSREQLLQAGWPDAPYVSDEALTKAVSLLRNALSDCCVARNTIRTVPRLGYVLLARPVTVETTIAELPDRLVLADESARDRVERKTRPASLRVRPFRRWAGVAAICAVVYTVGLSTGSRAGGDELSANERIRVRVEGLMQRPDLLASLGDDYVVVSDSSWSDPGELGTVRRRIAMAPKNAPR